MTSEVMKTRAGAGYHARMRTDPRPPPPAPTARLGALLREWRAARRLSQLELALEAGLSTRHLSCVETGRAQPSHEMVSRLADALEIPLRERNALFIAAGYAPQYRESALAAPELARMRRAIDFILEQQEPYPAFVTNRYWDVLLTNRGMASVLGSIKPGGPRHRNVLRQIFDPDDLRPLIGNWEEVAGDVLRHLQAEVALAPSDTKARALLEEVLAYPDVPERWRTREPGSAPLPLMTTVFRREPRELRFFSTLTTFATPRDVTLEELRIECMFPVDEVSAESCRALAQSGS
jgi:transcriptional regulator with XRE-family HTH domain